MNKAVLVLEDGTYFSGYLLGAEGETVGEVVFNTCMTGYQEVMTDPSYKGQIVTMTYPLIGNYGMNEVDIESDKPQVEGFIVKEACVDYSGSNSSFSLDRYLKDNNIVAIKGIDTRALTKHIRKFGSMFGIISSNTGHVDVLLERMQKRILLKRELVAEVSTKNILIMPGTEKKVIVMDFGCKQNIIRHLSKLKCEIIVVPYDTRFQKILEFDPDGIILSNGPGDPADLKVPTENIRSLLEKKPVWGICLGHQLIGLALGGKTYKLKFGHHGGNHAVKDLNKNKCYITSQNHNYALMHDSCDDIEITEINVNDNTVEGFRHKSLPVRGVQYHPEACPGPNDSGSFFKEFIDLI